MKNLIPSFILENYKNNIFQGELIGFTLFCDISGFTSISSKAMEGRNEGAEILSGILKKLYHPIVRIIYNHNGFITNFAGDGLISIFEIQNPTDNLHEAAINILDCAQNIFSEFVKNCVYKTRMGNFELNSKIGLSFGKMEWAIVGKTNKSFYFRGDAILGCSESLKRSNMKEMIGDRNFVEKIELGRINSVELLNKGDGFHKIIIRHKLKSSLNVKYPSSNSSNIAIEIFSKKFFQAQILLLKDKGEFRNVVSVFISFDSDMSKENLSELFSLVINSVKHNSGYHKDIDFGDKGGVIVNFFGVPKSSEEDVTRALRFVRYLKKTISHDRKLKHIRLKFGITYGSAYVGFIGGIEREQYAVIGDMVNLASRLMLRAEHGEVMVNESVVKNSNDRNQFDFIGEEDFKGFLSKIPVYRLAGIENAFRHEFSATRNAEKIEVYSSKIVGRINELKKLNEFVNLIIARKSPGIIYLSGEAGIGKSRLLREFNNNFSEKNKITLLYCRTSEILKDSLSPFKYLLRNFFKQSTSNSVEENKSLFDNIMDIIADRLDNASEQTNISLVKNELERTRSIIGAMIDLHWQNSLYEQLEPELRFENTLFAFCNLIIAECLLQPVILEIEDIQWLDKDSLEVLNMLLSNINNLPLAIICSSRFLASEKKTIRTAGKDIHVYEIQLSYFAIDEVKDLSKSILSDEIDDRSARFILQNTNGNPYFTEQLILDLKERNSWIKNNNALTLTEFNFSNIPDSINKVLTSRFDRLPEEVKEVVKTASVLGREFELKVLNKMMGEDKYLQSKIEMAVIQKILYPISGSKYNFTHSLLRDAVYGIQMPSDINIFHRLAAGAIRKLYGKKISQSNLEQIAYHKGIGYEIVDMKNKLLFNRNNLKQTEFSANLKEYTELQTTIADKHKKDYRNEKALEHYDLILKILSKQNEMEQSYYILLKKVEILNNISRWDEAERELRKNQVLADILKDKYKKCISMKYLAEVYRYSGDINKAIKILKYLKTYFQRNKYTLDLLSVLFIFAKIHYEMGMYKRALSVSNLQYTISKKLKDKKEIAKSLFNIAMCHKQISGNEIALSYFSKIPDFSKDMKDKGFTADINVEKGIIFYFRGEFDKSLSFFNKSKVTFAKLGNRRAYMRVLSNIGNIYISKKRFELAMNVFKEQIDFYKLKNYLPALATSYINMAAALIHLGKFDEAFRILRIQMVLDKKLQRPERIAMSLSNQGIILNYQGNFNSALTYHKKQLKIDQRLSNYEGIIRAFMNIGTVYKNLQTYTKAGLFFKKALDISNKFDIKKDIEYIVTNYLELLLITKKFIQFKKEYKKILNMYKNNNSLVVNLNVLREKMLLMEILNSTVPETKNYYVIKRHVAKLLRLSREADMELKAKIFYDLYFISISYNLTENKIKGINTYRNAALDLYNKLYLEFPNFEHKQKINYLNNS